MPITDFFEVAESRRSIRRFKPDPIPDGYIEKILNAGHWAMSGANAQPWEFLVVKDPETKKKMGEVFQEYREICFVMEQARSGEMRHTGYRGTGPKRAVPWVNAPVVICVMGDPRTVMASTLIFKYFDHPTFEHNMSNATHMICLAAAALGLGAQWISVHKPMGDDLKPILGIPPVIRVFTLVPIGYPAEQPASYRRELSDIVHHEKYDMSKLRSQEEIQEFVKYVNQRFLRSFAPPGK